MKRTLIFALSVLTLAGCVSNNSVKDFASQDSGKSFIAYNSHEIDNVWVNGKPFLKPVLVKPGKHTLSGTLRWFKGTDGYEPIFITSNERKDICFVAEPMEKYTLKVHYISESNWEPYVIDSQRNKPSLCE